ncbi:hypothetical protein BSL78_18927 [Apostichopus japonicus]|uniref:Uncharacterized protein n=1 Tax=Stichopus japonicus TaxID=307972 RepID=A0A2G8K890_STIJA|nr:hypothetical protein BSL78_18927 [Apostichopus japonicus]
MSTFARRSSNNDEAVEEIKQRLYENSILADLCQVPLIFVMFAHMAHDQRDFMKFKSVTQFFKHMIRCFYDTLKQKIKTIEATVYLHEMEHHELDKIAFEGLNKKTNNCHGLRLISSKSRARIYDQYISIGILVEEDEVSDDSTGTMCCLQRWSVFIINYSVNGMQPTTLSLL